MQQIADWLQKLGLGQYARTFAENEIDISVLPHLTDQDLKEIGVPLGPRRKILVAITAETGTTNATLHFLYNVGAAVDERGHDVRLTWLFVTTLELTELMLP
jgi:hypothetical protein